MTRIHGNKLSQTETCNLDKSFNKIKIPFACKTKLSTVHINYRDDVSYQSSMYIITYTRAKWLIIQSNLVLCSLRFTCKPLTRNSPFPHPYVFTTVLYNFSFSLFSYFFYVARKLLESSSPRKTHDLLYTCCWCVPLSSHLLMRNKCNNKVARPNVKPVNNIRVKLPGYYEIFLKFCSSNYSFR